MEQQASLCRLIVIVAVYGSQGIPLRRPITTGQLPLSDRFRRGRNMTPVLASSDGWRGLCEYGSIPHAEAGWLSPSEPNAAL